MKVELNTRDKPVITLLLLSVFFSCISIYLSFLFFSFILSLFTLLFSFLFVFIVLLLVFFAYTCSLFNQENKVFSTFHSRCSSTMDCAPTYRLGLLLLPITYRYISPSFASRSVSYNNAVGGGA